MGCCHQDRELGRHNWGNWYWCPQFDQATEMVVKDGQALRIALRRSVENFGKWQLIVGGSGRDLEGSDRINWLSLSKGVWSVEGG